MKKYLFFIIFALISIYVQPLIADTYYASPSGGGNGRSANSPFQIRNFWSVAKPGDVLLLLDGKYTGGNSMIAPPSGLKGTSSNPITIKALNDGKVEIDGQGARRPVHLPSDNDYFVFEGFNAHSSNEDVVHLYGGSDHNIFRRICAWDGPSNTTGNIFGIHSPYNLVEDCAAWGNARKPFSNSQGGDYTTFRRCWGRWEYTTGIGPKHTYSFGYNVHHVTVDNCIATWNSDMSSVDQSLSLFNGGAIKQGSTDTYQKISGLIAYVLPYHKVQGNYMFWWRGGSYSHSRDEFKDCIAYIEGHSSMIPFYIHARDPVPNGNTARNLTCIGGSSNSFSNTSTSNIYTSADGSELAAQYGHILDNPDGATVMKRYVDGQLTDEDLWPWPMNQRIIDAMIQSGREPVDVTRTVFELGGGTVPSDFGGNLGLTANINADRTSGAVPLTVSFQGSARNGTAPYSFSWNFGDGNNSTQQNLSHTFQSSGTFTVTLTVTDAENKSTTKSITINVNDLPGLTASITVDKTSGVVPLTINFQGGTSYGTAPYSYSWNFGDGNNSTEQNPIHTFESSGTYVVGLTVTDNENNSATDAITIIVNDPQKPSQNSINALKTITPITIDGNLSENTWNQAEHITFSNPSRSDNQVNVYTLWDNNFLYFAYEVMDSHLEAQNQTYWQDDGAEIYLDTENNKAPNMDSDDYHFIININDQTRSSGIAVKTTPKTDGYIMEIAIPWTSINNTPLPGKTLGLLLANNDRDNGIGVQFDWLNLIETGSYARPNLWGDILISDKQAGSNDSEAPAAPTGLKITLSNDQ